MITLHEILNYAYPDRGGWIVYGDDIQAGDGGLVPTLEEIETHREAAEEALAISNALAETNVIRDALVLTRAQFGEMMIRKNIKSSVIALIASIQDPIEKEVLEEWFEYAPTVRRISPKVEAFRTALNISEQTADQWFTEALSYE
jgi:hypothetical protein